MLFWVFSPNLHH